MENRQRLDWIDCAKGIAGILVILGHSVGSSFVCNVIRASIFSFHMPLFFTLSCITYRYSATEQEFVQKLKKSFRHLICPALIMYAFQILIDIRHDGSLISSVSYWTEKAMTMIFASGVSLEFYGMPVRYLGMMWFLFALFISRLILDYMHLHLDDAMFKLSICLTCCVGVLFGSAQWLPFSMDVALAVLPFLYYGARIRENGYSLPMEKSPVIWCVIWALTLIIECPNWTNWTFLELACRRYPMFPICFITAIAGMSIVIIVSKWFTAHCKNLFIPIIFIGKHAMILYFVHAMDYLWEAYWKNPDIPIPVTITRLLADIIVFAVAVVIIGGIQMLKCKAIKK